MKIRWGHFSDLHFQFDKAKYKTADLREKLVEKLKEEKEEHGKLDYIFITGDILHKGMSEEKHVTTMIEFIRKMGETAGCDYSNIIISPGNHDLKRSKARKNTLNLILEEYKEEKSLEYNGYEAIVVDNICNPFIDMCKRINAREDMEKLHWCIEMDILNIYILNTAIFAGQTYPGEKQAKKELEDTNLYICDTSLFELKNKVSDNSKLNIVLAHHGVECFQEQEREQFFNFLRDIKTDIYLCGHVHKNVARTLDEGGGAYQFSCGGLFVDEYNSPSFIIGEYDENTKGIELNTYQYLINVSDWRRANSLAKPYNEEGQLQWTPKRFKDNQKKDITKKSCRRTEKIDTCRDKFNEIKKISIGLDRDRDFIEMRGRAKHTITILGVGMSKLSKYALTGSKSLERLSQEVEIHLIMYDPEYLEENPEIEKMFSDFFGIAHLKENIRIAFDTLKEFCKKHNDSKTCKNKIVLSVYRSVPTMSAVIIDEKEDNAAMVVEYFGYHCGQSRPLFVIEKEKKIDENNSMFECVKEQVNMLKREARSIIE